MVFGTNPVSSCNALGLLHLAQWKSSFALASLGMNVCDEINLGWKFINSILPATHYRDLRPISRGRLFVRRSIPSAYLSFVWHDGEIQD